MATKNHQQFYGEPELYDEILGEHDPGELSYYKKLAAAHPHLLFLGPGTGRILGNLGRAGCRIVAVEKSAKMAQKCQENAPGARVLNQDILSLDLKEKFDLVVAPFEFLNHFDSQKLTRVLKIASKHLRPGGIFVAQLKNPHHCAGRVHQSELDYVELVNGRVLERGYVTYNEGKQTYTDIIERVFLDGSKHDVVTMNWHYFLVPQIRKIFKEAGFKLTKVRGNFKGLKFTRSSLLLLVEAHKV